jgi:hypothetical protein
LVTTGVGGGGVVPGLEVMGGGEGSLGSAGSEVDGFGGGGVGEGCELDGVGFSGCVVVVLGMGGSECGGLEVGGTTELDVEMSGHEVGGAGLELGGEVEGLVLGGSEDKGFDVVEGTGAGLEGLDVSGFHFGGSEVAGFEVSGLVQTGTGVVGFQLVEGDVVDLGST